MREKIRRFFPKMSSISKRTDTVQQPDYTSKSDLHQNLGEKSQESNHGQLQNALNPYFEQGQIWEQAIYSSVIKSRRLSWLVSSLLFALVITLSLALWLLIPLQRYEPYVITVDKTTGYLEMTRALQPGPLSDDVAVTQANIVRYVNARETYDYNGLGRDYKLTLLLSTGSAAEDYQALFSSNNPKGLDKTLGRTTRIHVTIKSVSLLNERTAQVRFSTEQISGGETITNYYVSTLRFRYSGTPMKNEWRFDNPLGFQVTEYRRDQESLPVKRSLNP